jgi:DNA polymerase III subunit epsilon
VVAEHMATALFSGRSEFAREPDGRWRLAVAPSSDVQPGLAAQARRDSFDEVLRKPLLPEEPLASLSYVVVDVETTGGRAQGGDRITEIAAVVVRNGEICEQFETLVNPERPIPPFITSITNITSAMVAGAPRFRDICDKLLPMLEGHVFVAHNATFDWGFVSSEVLRATGLRLQGRRLCTVRLARRMLPGLPRRSLDYVANYYGVEINGRHRAGGDALATAAVLRGLLRDAGCVGCLTWNDLEKLLRGSSAKSKRKPRGRSGLPRPASDDTSS